MTEKSLTEEVQLINLDELMARTSLEIRHLVALPVRVAKLDVKAAFEIVASKPGGPEVIAELKKRAKSRGSSSNPGTEIGHSEPDSGDPWYTRYGEVCGPGPTRVTFCCQDGPGMGCPGWLRVRFNMPELNDLIVLVHVFGDGTLSFALDGEPTPGAHSFAGDDWIALALSDVSRRRHNLRVIQETGYFMWLGTYYYIM